MKVLFATARFGEQTGGDGLYAAKLAGMLASRGTEIQVLTIVDGRFIVGEPTLKGSGAHLKVREVLDPIPQNEFSRNFYSPGARRSFSTALRLFKPDAIHFHGLHQYFTASSLSAIKEYAAPTLATIHDYKLLCGNSGFFSDRTGEPCLKCIAGKFIPPIFERCKRGSIVASTGAALQMGLWLYKNVLDLLTRIHAPSEFVGRLMMKNTALANKVIIQRFPPMFADDWIHTNRGENRNIVYVGRMVPHKGATIFAEAVKDVRRGLDIFGEGPELDETRRILTGHQSAHFHGWTSHEKIRDALQPGTIVVLPYLAHETFCFAVLEAMARGCCVVTTSRGAIPELIKHGVNGLCLDEPTPDQFKRSISDLVADPQKALAMGRKATEVLSGLDTLDQHAASMEQCYRQLK